MSDMPVINYGKNIANAFYSDCLFIFNIGRDQIYKCNDNSYIQQLVFWLLKGWVLKYSMFTDTVINKCIL
jgi:hypothetical protein